MKYYIEFWKRGLDFRGVSSRKEYWMAVLFNVIILFVITMVTSLITQGSEGALDWISGVYGVAMFIPSIAIGVRRLHDSNKSGWLYLVNLIPFIGSIIYFIFMLLGTVRLNNRWRMYDIQRGYIREDIFDEPLSNNQWTYKN